MRTFRHLPRLLFPILAFGACDDGGTSPENRVPAAMSMVSGSAQTGAAGAALADSLVARVTDAASRPVPGVSVVFTVQEGDGAVSPATATTNADGRAATRWTLGPVAGAANRAEARVLGPDGSVRFAVEATATAVAGPPSGVTATGGNGQRGVPGSTLLDSLTIRALDALGNPISGATVTWTVQTGGGSVSPATSQTNAQGVAKTRWTLGAASGTQRVDAVVGSAPPVTFQAASSFVSLTVLAPGAGAVVHDIFEVRAAATTARAGDAISVIRAAVEDRTVTLTPGAGAATGVLSLTGLADGAKTLRVWAVTVQGDSLEKQVPISYDRPPTLNVAAPLEGLVVRDGQLRVDVDCVDAGGCTRLDVILNRAPVATGTTGVHTTVPLTGTNNSGIEVSFRAADNGGQFTEVIRTIYEEPSPRLTELGSAGVRTLDVDGTRLLYVDTLPRALRIRPLAGGAGETVRALAANESIIREFLFPSGAIFVVHAESAVFGKLHEWRGGTLTYLDDVNSSQSLTVSGNWAIWNVGGAKRTLVRRDLAAGTNVTAATDAGNIDNDVTESGAVAYWNADFDVVLRDPAGASQVVSPADPALWFSYPVTDGQNVLFRRHLPCCPTNAQYRILRWNGGTLTELSVLGETEPRPHEFYETAGGWSAFLRRDGGGSLRGYVIGPDGVERLAAGGAGDARIEALAGNGDLVFRRGARRYVVRAPYTGAEIDIGLAPQGSVFFRGTTLYLLLGRSAFRVDY